MNSTLEVQEREEVPQRKQVEHTWID